MWTKATIVSRPMGVNDVNLPPVVTTGISGCTISSIFCLRPAAVKILHVVKLRETSTIGADEY
jgi:hypothetical protein